MLHLAAALGAGPFLQYILQNLLGDAFSAGKETIKIASVNKSR